MPSFGGFAINTGGLVNGLINNAVGGIANTFFPSSGFGGFGLGAGASLLGQMAAQQDATNRVVSLKPRDKAVDTVLGNAGGLMGPLRKTNNGMIWPYTPSINYSHSINYESISTVHANQDFHIYSKTPAVEFSVDGTFTVQNQQEGQYAMACLHFLRSVAKMNFGESDPDAGTPPPILLFNAYGPFIFNNTPVIVKSFSMNFPDEIDYVEVTVNYVNSVTTKTTPDTPAKTINRQVFSQSLPPLAGAAVSDNYNELNISKTAQGGIMGVIGALPKVGNIETIAQGVAGKIIQQTSGGTYKVWLPSMFKIATTMVVQHTPAQLRKGFNLPAFRNGATSQTSFV